MQKITKLDNGLRIVTQNMPGLETISMGIWNFVGGRDETKEINGVAHLLEHMAFKGTKTKNALQIAETIVSRYIDPCSSLEILNCSGFVWHPIISTFLIFPAGLTFGISTFFSFILEPKKEE